MGGPSSNLEVRKGNCTHGTTPARGPEGLPSERQMPRHNVAWALAGTEHAVEELEQEEGDERNNHTQTPKQHSLLCIEVVQASEKGNIDTYHALSGDRDMPSKVTLNKIIDNTM